MLVILANFNYYRWLLLPLFIFTARVMDVSLGTVRVIFISRGYKYLAPLVGFFEILIWLLAIGEVMKNLSSPICYISYASGFAMGNFVGICIAEKLSLGFVLIRVITSRDDATGLIAALKAENYGITSIDGQGAEGSVKLVFTIVPKRQVPNVANMIKKLNPNAFYSIEDVEFVEMGVLPLKRPILPLPWLNFRFSRKGK
jgi:uncharacterized protein YebE (UPF0316 family)